MVEIGSKLKELRAAKKMSQKDLANHLNVTPQTISKWELNKSYPDLDTLVKISQYFQVSTDEILGTEKRSFFEALFSKKGRGKMNKETVTTNKQKAVKSADNTLPKAVKVTNIANILHIEFDNGTTKFLKTHYVKDLTDALSLNNGKGKRANLLLLSRNVWVGTETEIKSDGTVILNGKDVYTPEELWYESADSIQKL